MSATLAPAISSASASRIATRVRTFTSHQPVAGAGHRLDHGGIADLAAEGQDRDPHDVAERVELVVPDALHQLLGAHERAVRRDELFQDRELTIRQTDVDITAAGRVPRGVEPDVVPLQDG